MRLRLFSLALLMGLLGSIAQAQTIIVNAETDVTQLDNRTIKSLFFQRVRYWPNGIPVTIVALERTTPLHEEFSKNILKVLPFRLESTWSKLSFTGVAKPVVRVNSVSEMLSIVSSTPGAIGYIDEETKTSEPNIVFISRGES